MTNIAAVGRYRKKPVVIEAARWLGPRGNGISVDELQRWGATVEPSGEWGTDYRLVIPTLEGDHVAEVGDWIIRGVKGEFYPCKPDIFEQTYEEA